jgi:hypothetical protein
MVAPLDSHYAVRLECPPFVGNAKDAIRFHHFFSDRLGGPGGFSVCLDVTQYLFQMSVRQLAILSQRARKPAKNPADVQTNRVLFISFRDANGCGRSVPKLNCGVRYALVGQSMKQLQPLHKAAQNGDLEMVKALLLSKAKVNARCFNGTHERTPLHIAAANGHKEVVEILLANKADFRARDTHGQTPLVVAQEAGHYDVAEALRNRHCSCFFCDRPFPDDSGKHEIHVYKSLGRIGPISRGYDFISWKIKTRHVRGEEINVCSRCKRRITSWYLLWPLLLFVPGAGVLVPAFYAFTMHNYTAPIVQACPLWLSASVFIGLGIGALAALTAVFKYDHYSIAFDSREIVERTIIRRTVNTNFRYMTPEGDELLFVTSKRHASIREGKG